MKLFIYGTLLDDILRERLLGRVATGPEAVLYGYTVVDQLHSPLPVIMQSAGAVAKGMVLSDLTDLEIAKLDAYEIPFNYNPLMRDVHVGDQVIAAQVYIPDVSIPRSDRPWSLSRWQAHSGALTREMAVEIGSYDPLLAGEALRQQWKMIALRAGVRLRARQDKAPSVHRYMPQTGDVEITSRLGLKGGFFKLSGFDVMHRTFKGTTAGPLRREVLVACDAAIVLPYDPKTDCVLLVEQLRMGALIRGDANPWLLEPVAGMVDGDETPLEAARRETQEEAGLTSFTLEEMFTFYPSPGASTDYFHCYVARGDLPLPTTYTGGLEDEHEDLRLHVMPFENALALIDTGEINVGPLITMLFWLARHRDRLRAAA